ncbi:molybdenum cofactor guanylyltransferase [Arsenicicoccus dermatophilus]|uniref:molybdenum cofactor guanylyltransferase n=1 Tax=Arsenicicoccus dermatophilus TaxID=1076331 RepID=UPI001F4CEC15|nr:NTP transferase domain-containing protein [Arsenicicoccus dermatophilus]MCH8614236.1 NTP transferase domain-containing protein [Arsenicicoccus dermatophilus]
MSLDSLVTVVVLCGGTSERMGGQDKTAATLDDTTVLDHLLGRLPAGWEVVCVGQERPTTRPVGWTREEPPLGGPAAGIAAGAALSTTPVTVVIAGDLPFAGEAAELVVAAFERRRPGVEAVAIVDETGQLQPLLAAYDTHALRGAFPSGTRDVSVHRQAAAVRMSGVEAPTTHALLDVDTPADLDTARARCRG